MSAVECFCLYSKRVLLASLALLAAESSVWAREPTQLEGYHGGDGRIYTDDGVWGGADETMAECGGDFQLMQGIAISRDESFGHAILCAAEPVKYQPGEPRRADAPPNMAVYYNRGRTIDQELAKDIAANGGDVWWPTDRSLGVFECSDTEVMTGLAQYSEQYVDNQDVLEQTVRARCTPTNKVATDCQVIEFKDGDVAESEPFDWAPGYTKGTCGPGRYVKAMVTYYTATPGVFGPSGGVVPGTVMCCSPGDLPTTATFP